MSSKVISRLCVFFIGVPAVIALILLNQFNHLALHVVVSIASFLACAELYHLFEQNFKMQNKALVVTLTGFIHFTMLLAAVFNFSLDYVNFVYILTMLICLGWEVISKDTFEDSNQHIVSSIATLTYLGFLFTFLSRMTFLNSSREVLIMFLTMVFLCDSLAWFFGVLFGKNNKGFIKASPNKSIAGFLGGIFGSILSGIICWYLWNSETGLISNIFEGSVLKLVGLGFLMAICSITGDLTESVIKRSADIKDSGTIIPGRGGILDSIDSIVFSAPVFYFAITHMYPSLLETIIK